MSDIPFLSHLILLRPKHVLKRLDALHAVGLVRSKPNAWQLSLGVLRMWGRVLFRSDTIGNCQSRPVRNTRRARWLENRAFRFPFLLKERAVAPWDFTGLLSSPDRVMHHLLGAHHDRNEFLYDLQLLAADRATLERTAQQAQAIVDGTHPRAEWLKDLVVFDHYHQDLVEALNRALGSDGDSTTADVDDPDISLVAYLQWCARQPETPAESLALLFNQERGALT